MPSKIDKVKDFIHASWNIKSQDTAAFELLSPHIVHTLIIGSRIGLPSYMCALEDWHRAFPNFQANVKSIAEANHIVTAQIEYSGRHYAPYQDLYSKRESIFSRSTFLELMQARKPDEKLFSPQSELIFIFKENKVTHFSIGGDEIDAMNQLGLPYRQSFLLEQRFKSTQQGLAYTLKNALSARLTSSEMRCLALTLSSFSSKHAAQLLSISHRTVEAHLRNAYSKLGCSYKSQCLEMMCSNGTFHLWQELCSGILAKAGVI